MGVKDIHIKLDFRSGIPIYTQVMDHIRQMVANGELQQGDQLPTVRQLATDLRVNFNTIARAYRMLDEAGLISTQHGRGTYIWETPSQETLERLRKEGLLGLTQRYLQEAAHLGASAEDIWSTFEEQYHAWKAGSITRAPDKS